MTDTRSTDLLRAAQAAYEQAYRATWHAVTGVELDPAVEVGRWPSGHHMIHLAHSVMCARDPVAAAAEYGSMISRSVAELARDGSLSPSAKERGLK